MSESNNNILPIINTLQTILDLIPKTCHITVDACNDFVLPPDWDFYDRINPNFHIAFVKSGKGSYIIDERHIPMEKGRIYFLSSGYRHSRVLDKANLPRLALLRFSIIDNLTMKPSDISFKPLGFSYVPGDVPAYYMFFEKLFQYYNTQNNKYSAGMAGSMVCSILYEIYNDQVKMLEKNPQDERINRAVKLMEANLDKDILLDRLAEEAGLSKNYFRELFYRQYDMNPKQYLINLKIRKAKEMLTESRYSIKNIAELLGYSDQYAFSKQFHLVTGSSPSQVRKGR